MTLHSATRGYPASVKAESSGMSAPPVFLTSKQANGKAASEYSFYDVSHIHLNPDIVKKDKT
jgi:hypothetical protein